MDGGGREPSTPSNGGEFLLRLLQTHSQQSPALQQSFQTLNLDPAVASVGPAIPYQPPFGGDLPLRPPQPQWSHSPPPFYSPLNFFAQGFSQNPSPYVNSNFAQSPPDRFNQAAHLQNLQLGFGSFDGNAKNLSFPNSNVKSNTDYHQEQRIVNENHNESFPQIGKLEGSRFEETEVRLGSAGGLNSLQAKYSTDLNRGYSSASRVNEQERISGSGGNWGRQGNGGNNRPLASPPGFLSNARSGGNRGRGDSRHSFDPNVDRREFNFSQGNHRTGGSVDRYDRSVGSSGSSRTSDRGERNRRSGGSSDRYDHDIGLTQKYGRGVGSCDKNMEQRFTTRNGENLTGSFNGHRLSGQIDSPGLPAGSNLLSVVSLDKDDSLRKLPDKDNDSEEESGDGLRDSMTRAGDQGHSELEDLEEQLMGSLKLEDGSAGSSDKKKHRDKDYRSDRRGQWLLGQRLRNLKRLVECRTDIDTLNAPFLAVFESLIPEEEEKTKQKQLLTLLEKIVSKEWPGAQLYVYGSCANSFGFSKSDIDICLRIDDAYIDKSAVLLKLADLLQLENLQNVQALTRARVPIVKLMDPVTGISCDICINNVLAVVNTKLLRDYAHIDVRLRQLAFIVKHWAKSRGVNETYQGTLSSYAYVMMCIHFLQQRRPAILPCLQVMEPTYSVTIDNVKCSFFDRVEELSGFGARNGESIARLVWAFFNYWAYCHDYANDVVSVRTGSTLSKRAKDWTRRIGNDRHLICIEDPFDVSHDLGRVVDRNSIRVIREEFERAAEIMQYDPNPCAKLLEPYVPV